jgi:hypothetical protein
LDDKCKGVVKVKSMDSICSHLETQKQY